MSAGQSKENPENVLEEAIKFCFRMGNDELSDELEVVLVKFRDMQKTLDTRKLED